MSSIRWLFQTYFLKKRFKPKCIVTPGSLTNIFELKLKNTCFTTLFEKQISSTLLLSFKNFNRSFRYDYSFQNSSNKFLYVMATGYAAKDTQSKLTIWVLFIPFRLQKAPNPHPMAQFEW